MRPRPLNYLVYVLTTHGAFVSVHRTREGAEEARAAFVEATRAEWAASHFESLREASEEGPDVEVNEVRLWP